MKLTQEKKLEEFNKIKQFFKEKGYELLSEEYKGSNEKLFYICPKHRSKGVLTTTWSNCKNKNSGCRYCANEYVNSLKRMDENIIKETTEGKGFIFNHVGYEDGCAIVFFYCKEHYDKGIQSKKWVNMKKSSGKCNYCNGRIRTDEDFKMDMSIKFPNIKILSKYKSATTKINCECNVCGNEWKTTANALYTQKYGCRVCANAISWNDRLKTKESFQLEIDSIYDGKITILSDYVGSHDKIQCICNIDKTAWWQTPTSLLTGSIGCPTCYSKSISERCKKSNEKFLEQLNKTNPNIIPLEEYIDDHSKILCTCKIHTDYKWYAAPNKILHKNTGCPKCSKSVSSNEIKLQDILCKWGYNFCVQKRFPECRDKYPLPFDIYLEDFNILIEYDGEQHYKIINRNTSNKKIKDNFEKTKYHDEIKNNYCRTHKIPLIRIPYWEQDNLENYLFDKLLTYGAIEEIA